MYIISEIYLPAYCSPDACRGYTFSDIFSSLGDARAHSVHGFGSTRTNFASTTPRCSIFGDYYNIRSQEAF
jgi:hypothetical protein